MSVTIGNLIRRKSQNFFVNILPFKIEDDFIYKEDWKQLSGTVTIENEAQAVVGVETKFTEELSVGDVIKIDGADFGDGDDETTVTAIASDTALTVGDETIAATGGSAGADAFKECPEDEKFIPIHKKDFGLQVVHFIQGFTEDGHYFLYDFENEVIRAYASGGTEVETLDPDENDDGDTMQDVEAKLVVIGR